MNADIEYIISNLPREVPEHVKKECEELLSENLMIYSLESVYIPLEDRKRQMVKTVCTCCGTVTYLKKIDVSVGCSHSLGNMTGCTYGFEDITGEKIVNGITYMCPECGAGVTARHITHKTEYIGERSILTIHNVLGKLCLLQWKIEKRCDKTGKVLFIPYREEGCVISNKKFYAVTGRVVSFFYNYIYYSDWRIYKGKKFKFQKNFEKIFFCGNIEDTESKHCAIEEYISLSGQECDPLGYIKLYCYVPQIENLVRQKIISPVNEAIDRCIENGMSYTEIYRSFSVKNADIIIDKKKVKPHEMLGVEKDELWIAKKYSYDTFDFYKQIKADMHIRLSENTLDTVEIVGTAIIRELFECMNTICHKTSIVKMLNYLIRQNVKNRYDVIKLKDYWQMYAEVYGEMREDSIFPKDMYRSHDNITQRLKQIKDKEKSEEKEKISLQIEERYKELCALSMVDEEMSLMIRPCKDYTELSMEGKLLGHCVESYAGAIARGDTSIFLIRHTDFPNTPFYTLEFRNGKINQDHGYKNALQTPEIIKFEEKWLDYIERKLVQNGKCST